MPSAPGASAAGGPPQSLPTGAPAAGGPSGSPPAAGAGVFLRGLNQNDPKVMAAYNACKSQIPAALVQAQQQRSQALTAVHQLHVRPRRDDLVRPAGGR